MKLNLITLKDFLKQRELDKYTLNNDKLQNFTNNLKAYREKVLPLIDTDNEDSLRSILDKNFLSTLSNFDDVKANKKRIDLSMWIDNRLKIIIEAKIKSNKTEMITDDNINKKAFYESLYYFIEQTQKEHQPAIHSVMITDYQYIYLFEKVELQKLISPRSDIQLAFNESQTQSNSKDTFYKTMSTIKNDTELTAIKFDLLNDDIDLLYRIFDTPNIMHESTKADPNSLNKGFYNELLYIMGLKEQNSILIKNSVKNTLLDLTMSNVKDEEDARSLNILWLNRILFLKILESQLKVFRNEKDFVILNTDQIIDYSRLNKLFFKILSVPRDERFDETEYTKIPYLNSSLFEKTELENKPNHDIIYLDNDKMVKIPKESILRKGTNFNKNELPLLEYLLRFLDCYQFNNDSDVADTNTVIKSSVLGLVFEKLNGYKDGSHFTPASITMYMSKEVIQRRILDVCNKEFELHCKTIKDLRNDLQSDQKGKAHQLINNISIIDPAVGSGHFLVSCLNELIRIKSELGLLHDDIKVTIENDELLIKWYNGKSFIYQLDNEQITSEINEIQQTIFETKKHIIENQLYGVDINPNSVNICRLRLWIELLKHTYYTNDTYIDLEVLPNLEFKVMTANSLIPVPDVVQLFQNKDKEKLKELLKLYYNSSNNEKQNIKQETIKLIKEFKESTNIGIIQTYEPFNTTTSCEFFDSRLMFGVDNFDIVIGNPPYVDPTGIPTKTKATYKSYYKENDDLYNYFYRRGFEFLKDNGVLGYITSNSFLTTQSKQKLRQLLQRKELLEIRVIDNIFENAVVWPAIVITKNNTMDDYTFNYIDSRDEEDVLSNNTKAHISINMFKDSPNNVFYAPNSLTKSLSQYFSTTKPLIQNWWASISTSKNILNQQNIIAQYRNSLKSGDITLLGLLTDGGVGLQTGENGHYIGVREGTKDAERTYQQRLKKIAEFNQEYNTTYNITTMSELEIRKLFTQLKDEHGRDVFGQGFLYQIISNDEIADVSTLTEDEKMNGIEGERTFVPYDKGDKDGNRWYMPTVYGINWNRENVKALQSDPKARWQGYNFFFKEGFSWSDVLLTKSLKKDDSTYIKVRVKESTINDVKSMSMYLNDTSKLSIKYLLVILNSYIVFYYVKQFINNTISVQFNDLKQLPIIIPTTEQLQEAENLFDRAKAIKEQQIAETLTKDQADELLQDIQKKVDDYVERLYGLSEDEVKMIEMPSQARTLTGEAEIEIVEGR